MKNNLLLTIVLSLITAASLKAQTTGSKLELFTDSLFKEQVLYGNVLVKDKGEIILQKSYGYADIENKKPHTAASLFDIGSVAKLFTSTAILQLKEKGKLRLTDSVFKILPGFPFKNITIQHLITHTAGLPYAFDELYWNRIKIPNLNNDTILVHLKSMKPLWEPGVKWEYSNTSFCMLALIVEKISGKKFPEYVAKNIFQPAGMKDSYFYMHDYTKIRSYREDNLIKGKGIREDTNSVIKVTENVFGTGDVLSTAIDLQKFEEAFFGNKLLSQKTIDEALTPQRYDNDSLIRLYNVADSNYMGLGWDIISKGSDGKIVGHSGGVPGTKSFFYYNPEKRQTCILLDNFHNIRVDITGENIFEIMNNKSLSVFKSSRVQSLTYLRLLVHKGADEAFTYVQKCLADTVNYTKFNEGVINNVTYFEIVEKDTYPNKIALALEAYKINIFLFPKSSYAFNYYAWALAKAGKKDDAIAMYKISIALDPNNEDAKTELKDLLGEKQ